MKIINSEKRFPTIIIIAVVALLILFGFALWQEESNQGAIVNTGPETSFQPTAINEETIGEPAKELTEEESNEASDRDETRLTDIKKMQEALENYKDNNGNYPDNFEGLVPDYMEIVPTDPSLNGTEYNYTGIGASPYMYYDMTYTLEVGVNDINPGMHVANPDGIAVP
ncbi:MAG: hypothetical protein ACNFW9_04965 [Candidatus Kerfeldbacteria bacterium]